MGFWIQRTLVLLLVIFSGIGFAETFHLSDDQGWKNVAESADGEYMLAISKIKQQLLTGNRSDVVEALEQLKSKFPQMAGEEIDAFLAAEQQYAAGDWNKAAATYKQFTDAWPVSGLRSAALERLYSIATAYLQGQKRKILKVWPISAYDNGEALMRDVADRAGNSPLGLRSLTTLAEAQEKKKELMEAYFTWQEIAARWPTGETRQTATLRMAQTLHASYDGPQYDAAVLDSAQTYFEDYLHQFPDAAAEIEIPQTLKMIKEQLAYKEYETGFYYERTGNPEAANLYYKKVTTQWPNSKAAKMAQARTTPDAVPPVKMTPRRKILKGVSGFLDSWFWLQPVFQNKQPLQEN